jgi:Family of unknown function (DUF5696)
MQRRELMQAILAAGATGLLPAVSATSEPRQHPLPGVISPVPHMLADISRDNLRVKLYSDATAIVSDRQNGAEWRFGSVAFQEEGPVDEGAVWLRTERSICEQYPGRFAGVVEGAGFRFWVLDSEGSSRGSFHAALTVQDNGLDWRILQIDDSLPSLSFPPPLECESLVLPQHLGRWVRSPLQSRYCWPFFSAMNMRWFGGLRGQNGYLAILPDAQCADAVVSATELSAAPMWLQRLGEWKGDREIRYQFVRGNYVALAKTYRAWAKAHGLHRSLTDKLRDTPALSALTSGRLISCLQAEPAETARFYQDRLASSPASEPPTPYRIYLTHRQATQVLRELPAAGVPRALVVIRGWIRGGYDWSHPDIWPPDERLGSVQELRALSENSGPFTVALHDNYQDSYKHNPSWPLGVNRSRQQRPMRGGYWDGGQAYILSAAAGLSYARRNWKMEQQLALRAMYIDTTSAVQTYQSFEPGKLQQRTDDVANKAGLLRFYKECGVVLGSEEGADFAIPYIDWCENRHERSAGESIPLWPLVFHDAVVSGRYTGSTWAGAVAAGNDYPSWLLDMLWGYAALSEVGPFEKRSAAYERMRATRQLDAWFATISTDAMDDHAFLSSDGTLERTQFSSGRSIIVNFAPEPQRHDGNTVAAHGYSAFDERGGKLVF